MAKIHPTAVTSEVGARSRKLHGGFRQKQTLILMIGNDGVWGESCPPSMMN